MTASAPFSRCVDEQEAMQRGNRDIRSERGVAMIEFALVLPILLFLALGIVDFGRAMNYWNDANQVAADAARFAAVDRNPGATAGLDFRDWVRTQVETGELATGELAGGGDSPSTRGRVLEVCVFALPGETTAAGAVGSPIKVTLTQRFYLIPFLGQTLKWPAVDIKGEAVMRLEQPYTGPTNCDSSS